MDPDNYCGYCCRLVSNFAFSFAIISILTGVSTLFNTGLTYGGTISMVYGWLLVGAFTVVVGLSMAEICSVFPTSGGLYYWSSQLAGPEWGPFASWFTGWYHPPPTSISHCVN
jgi:amino acid transporter